MYTTVAELDECGRYAWPGGYPLEFFAVDEHGDNGGVVMCFDCARETLLMAERGEEYSDGLTRIDAQICEEQQYYGGVTCDACYRYVIDPVCPECGDEFGDKPRLQADNVDALWVCRTCAAKMVVQACDDAATEDQLANCLPERSPQWYRAIATNPRAKRLPGVGIQIIDSPYGVPWYANVGTIYRYR